MDSLWKQSFTRLVHAHVYVYHFRDHHQRMSSLLSGFGDPFSRSLDPNFGFPSTHPALGNGGRADRPHRNNQQVAPADMFTTMFGDMFTNMNSMMANMHQNFVSAELSFYSYIWLSSRLSFRSLNRFISRYCVSLPKVIIQTLVSTSVICFGGI